MILKFFKFLGANHFSCSLINHANFSRKTLCNPKPICFSDSDYLPTSQKVSSDATSSNFNAENSQKFKPTQKFEKGIDYNCYTAQNYDIDQRNLALAQTLQNAIPRASLIERLNIIESIPSLGLPSLDLLYQNANTVQQHTANTVYTVNTANSNLSTTFRPKMRNMGIDVQSSLCPSSQGQILDTVPSNTMVNVPSSRARLSTFKRP